MPSLGSILFFRPGGLGDLLAALPSVRLLRRAFPGQAAILAAADAPGRLAVRAGLAEKFLPADDPSLAGLFSGPDGPGLPVGPSASAPGSLWAWLVKEPAPDFRSAAIRIFGDEARIIVYEAGSGIPVIRFFFKATAAALAVADSDSDFEACARLSDLGPPPFPLPAAPFVVIHPGSGGTRKNWPWEGFLAAAKVLSERGLGGYFVTGPAEGTALSAAAALNLPDGWFPLRDPPLVDLAGLLSRCGGYLGNDSGVTHLAAAAGAPVLALFRDDNLPAWRPCGRTVVLQAPEPAGIPFPEVRAALARFPAPSALQYRS